MMLSDAPRYRSGHKASQSNKTAGATAEDDAREVEGFFRSNLKQ